MTGSKSNLRGVLGQSEIKKWQRNGTLECSFPGEKDSSFECSGSEYQKGPKLLSKVINKSRMSDVGQMRFREGLIFLGFEKRWRSNKMCESLYVEPSFTGVERR